MQVVQRSFEGADSLTQGKTGDQLASRRLPALRARLRIRPMVAHFVV
jgi:hypothetical protein